MESVNRKNLMLTYEEHATEALHKLTGDLLDEEQNQGDVKRLQRHRIFQHNVFEDVDIRTIKRYESVLKYTLTCFGHYLDENLIAIGIEQGKKFPPSPSPSMNLSQLSSENSFLQPGLRSGNSILLVDRKNRSNFRYDGSGAIHLKSKKNIKFTSNKSRQPIMLAIIARVLKLLGTDNYMTQRELYYLLLKFCKIGPNNVNRSNNSQSQQNPSTQPSQPLGSQGGSNENRDQYNPNRLNIALDDICCMVGCSKVHLHILPQTKGLIYGNILIKFKNGTTIDCRSKKCATHLPHPTVPIVNLETDAKFVLIIEKDSVMQKIIDQEEKSQFVAKFKAILITAKGYPDSNTKAFVNFLWKHLKIPLLALTDADPHGVEIVCSYKFGSYCTAYEGLTMVTPQIRWLGLLPSDLAQLKISDDKTYEHTANDLSKLNSLLARPYLKNKQDWLDQLMLMRALGRKAEIECLDNEFLVTTYLPNKLKYASWL